MQTHPLAAPGFVRSSSAPILPPGESKAPPEPVPARQVARGAAAPPVRPAPQPGLCLADRLRGFMTGGAIQSGQAVEACKASFSSALSKGGGPALVRAFTAVCEGRTVRYGDALQAAMAVTAPHGADVFRAAVRSLESLMHAREDRLWGDIVHDIWQAGRAQPPSAQGQSIPREHMLACLGATLGRGQTAVGRLELTLGGRSFRLDVDLALDAFAASVQCGHGEGESLAVILQAWDELETSLPLMQGLLRQVTRQALLSCILALVTPEQPGRPPRLARADGAQAWVALARASSGGDAREAAMWLAATATQPMRPYLLDEIFAPSSDDFSGLTDSVAIRALVTMIEDAAARVSPAHTLAWLLRLGKTLDTVECKSAQPLGLRLPKAHAHEWAFSEGTLPDDESRLLRQFVLVGGDAGPVQLSRREG